MALDEFPSERAKAESEDRLIDSFEKSADDALRSGH
jgi:hypothetical protein